MVAAVSLLFPSTHTHSQQHVHLCSFFPNDTLARDSFARFFTLLLIYMYIFVFQKFYNFFVSFFYFIIFFWNFCVYIEGIRESQTSRAGDAQLLTNNEMSRLTGLQTFPTLPRALLLNLYNYNDSNTTLSSFFHIWMHRYISVSFTHSLKQHHTRAIW